MIKIMHKYETGYRKMETLHESSKVLNLLLCDYCNGNLLLLFFVGTAN